MAALPPVLARGRPSGLAYGGDYNPEQFPAEIWAQDVALMQEAGVSLVTVGVFAWARIQPVPGAFEFDWLDRVLGLLHDGGVAIDLATATASPPAWLVRAHPELALVDRQNVRQAHGSRQAWCPSSPVYRQHALALVEQLARRYAGHPGLVLW
nr:beta-galactosidase [Geodermatophilaceae bacterium]